MQAPARAMVTLFLCGSLFSCGESKPPVDLGEVALAINMSDDYLRNKELFVKAAAKLIDDGTCTLSEMRDMGGWWRSPNKGNGFYFTYCGGMTAANRLYLDIDKRVISH